MADPEDEPREEAEAVAAQAPSIQQPLIGMPAAPPGPSYIYAQIPPFQVPPSPLDLVYQVEDELLNDPELEAQVYEAQILAQHNAVHHGHSSNVAPVPAPVLIPVPVPGTLAHYVAVANAALWVDRTYEKKIEILPNAVVVTQLNDEEYGQGQEHYRLMGLKAEADKISWLERVLTKLVAKRRAQNLSAKFLVQDIAKKSGRRHKLATENWALQGLPVKQILLDDLRGDKRDFQGLNWTELTGWSTARVREKRAESYEMLDPKPRGKLPPMIEAKRVEEWRSGKLPETANFMRFRRYDFFKWRSTNQEEPKPVHRNVLVCGPRNTVFYTLGKSKVWWKDITSQLPDKHVIELRHPDGFGNQTEEVNITAIAAKHGVLAAGTKYGEFGLRSTLCNLTDPKFQVTGFTRLSNLHPPIRWMRAHVTHIDIVKSRSSGSTQAILATHDSHVYTLDCTTGKLMGEHNYVNASLSSLTCTAQSPDDRLRVIVGRSREVYIAEADGGRKLLHKLTGHHDTLTACAWSENGIHLATAGHDKLVKTWDARMLTHADGSGNAYTTISSKMSPVHGLEFSPVGSGRRCLMMREEADVLSFVDSRSFGSKQSLEVLGQLTGGGWSEDGQRVVVGVQDDMVGGMLELERCGWGGDEYAMRDAGPPRRSKADGEILRQINPDWGLDYDNEEDGVVRQEQYRNRSTTYWKRKAARAGDFSDLL